MHPYEGVAYVKRPGSFIQQTVRTSTEGKLSWRLTGHSQHLSKSCHEECSTEYASQGICKGFGEVGSSLNVRASFFVPALLASICRCKSYTRRTLSDLRRWPVGILPYCVAAGKLSLLGASMTSDSSKLNWWSVFAGQGVLCAAAGCLDKNLSSSLCKFTSIHSIEAVSNMSLSFT